MIPLTLVLIGLVGLWRGTLLAVQGSVRLCQQYGLSQGFVGLAVLSVGTDLPELVVALSGSVQQLRGVDASGVIVGASLGSVVAQGSMVLGVAGLFGYLPVAPRMIRRDGLTLMLAIGLAAMLAADGVISRAEGIVMLLVYGIYFVAIVYAERRSDREKEEVGEGRLAAPVAVGVGLAAVMISAQMVVTGGIGLAAQLGVSQTLLSVLLVGAGTSLPELALSVRAASEKRASLSVGNVIGSNIFDLLVPIGVGAAIFPLSVERGTLLFDLPAVAIVAACLLVFLVRRRGLQRHEAGALLGLYAVYVTVRVLSG